MSSVRNVAIIVGSLRRESFTRKIAHAFVQLAPASLKSTFIEIGDLPLYNQDTESEQAPRQWTAFRQQVRAADAVLFATPEYNRSMPGCLKNALDVGSRPYGQSAWDRMPAAVISVSPGAIGGFGANHHLRQSLVFLNVPVLQQPEAYIGGVAGLLDDKGALANDGTREFIRKFATAFAAWIESNPRT